MITQEIKEFPRTEVLADVVVDNREKKFTAVTFNISRGGVCFVASNVLAVGDRCTVYLKKNRNIFLEKGTIKWLRYVDEKQDMIKYGMEFREPVEQERIDLFLRCCN